MYFAHACTASTEPWNRPGASELPVSAITPMWISVGVTPTSLAVSASLPPPPLCAAAAPAVTAVISVAAQTSAIQRNRLTYSPLLHGSLAAASGMPDRLTLAPVFHVMFAVAGRIL